MQLRGRFDGMRITIDGAGRIVVPKPIRDRLQLEGGAILEVAERDGVIEIRPAPVEVEIVETPHGPVARPLGEVAPLDDATVRDVLEQVRR
jgi:AbrB family looped-hinge helix DNA binding protein